MLGMKFILPAFAAFTLIPAVFESASAASDPTGIWLDDTGRGAVEIKQCGSNLCGNVVWVKSASDSSGCGKPIIGDVKPVGGGRWDNGWIYSPEKGRKYDVELTPLANGNLKVLGYAGMKFLSKTMIWKRAPQDLQLCGQTDVKAEAKTSASKKPDVVTGSITPPPAPAAAVSVPAKQAKAPETAPAPSAKSNDKAQNDKAQEAKAPAASPDENKSADANDAAKDDSTASNDDGDGNDIAGALGKLKIGDLSLDKVLTRTKSGKCKVDLPWFKVTLNCEQE